MDFTPILVEEGNERNDSYFEALTDCNSNNIWSFVQPGTASSTLDSQKIEYVRELEFELERFEKFPRLNRRGCPFKFYQEIKYKFPPLSSNASLLFSIPPSSVSSERLFSEAGLIYGNKLRNRLSEKRAEECMLIKAKLLRKFEEPDHTLPQDVFLSDDESQEE